MNTESLQQSEEDRLIGLEEQNEISSLVRGFAIEKLGYSRPWVSSMELSQNKPQTNVNIAFSKRAE